MTPDDPRHGTTAGHSAGCRLACCREARNADERTRRKRRQVLGIVRAVDNTGTVRRIQAMWAMGWTSLDIAKACGWSTPQAVTEIVSTRSYTYVTTADAIAHAYDSMSMRRGPSEKNRRDATRKGWYPPLAWNNIDDPNELPNLGGVDDQPDPVVVARILGHDASLARGATVAERRAVVAAWPGSLNDLERLTGWRADRYIDREDGAA